MSPLPFAPPPKDSSLYQQLESTTLQTLTADQLDTIRAKTFSQGTDGNEDEYRRLLLLGLAADQLSLSGPLPGTGKVVNIETTSNGFYTFDVASAGEVWKCTGASISTNDGGTVVLKTGTDLTNSVELAQETAANVTFQPSFGADIYVDENIKLGVSISSIVGTIIILSSWVRVR